MTKIIRIGVDTSKTIFVLHGVDAAEQPVLRKKLRRKQFLEFFAKLEPTKIGLGGTRIGRRRPCLLAGSLAMVLAAEKILTARKKAMTNPETMTGARHPSHLIGSR